MRTIWSPIVGYVKLWVHPDCQSFTLFPVDYQGSIKEQGYRTTQFVRARSSKQRTNPRFALPSLEKIIEIMQINWDAALENRARRKAEIAAGLRFRVFVRDSFLCVYCGNGAKHGAILHADHVIPRSKGGETSLKNLVTACMDCNLGKSNHELPVRE